MKSLLKIISVIVVFSILTGNSFAQNDAKMYKAKSGIIEYKLSGKTTGTETLYFDHHGNREARYTKSTTKILGMTTTENRLEIRIDSIMYSIDLEEKTGTRVLIPFHPTNMTEQEWKEWEDWGKQMMDDLGFEQTGEGNVLGKKCEIWEGLGSKIWIWQNLSLKSEVNMMGKWVIEATKVDLKTRINPSKFKIPAGIKMTDVNYEFGDEEYDTDIQLDSTASDVEKELEKGLNELKSILGVKKKKKK